jgi:hypothetical protein
MQKASPPIHAEASHSHGQSITSAGPAELLCTAPSKIASVRVYTRHFDDLNRFEAARKVGDTCLNTTIPALETNYGVSYEQIPEKSPNNWGKPCDCTRYRMPASQHERADKVIAGMFKRAKQSPVVTHE